MLNNHETQNFIVLMKTFIVWFGYLLLFLPAASAQHTETIRVQAGEDISKTISDSGVYRFRSFTTGSYSKHDGTTSSAKLNYNIFTGEMQYIGLNGDTLSIANSDEINFFKINDVVFFYRNGYKEVIADYNALKLSVESDFKLTFEQIGALGQPGGEAVVTNMSTYNSATSVYQLALNQNAVIKKRTTYYILNDNETPVIATKKNFLKIFSASKASINKYVKENNIDFNKQEDLKKLFIFCARPGK